MAGSVRQALLNVVLCCVCSCSRRPAWWSSGSWACRSCCPRTFTAATMWRTTRTTWAESGASCSATPPAQTTERSGKAPFIVSECAHGSDVAFWWHLMCYFSISNDDKVFYFRVFLGHCKFLKCALEAFFTVKEDKRANDITNKWVVISDLLQITINELLRANNLVPLTKTGILVNFRIKLQCAHSSQYSRRH